MLSQLTTPSTRADVLAWYVTTSTLGSSAGSEASGRIIHYLKDRRGWTEVDTYHALFWVYTVMGLVNALLTLLLTSACELDATKTDSNEGAYAEVPQDEDIEASERGPTTVTAPDNTATFRPPTPPLQPTAPPSRNWFSRAKHWATNNFAQISSARRSIMYKLWFLLAVDSLADGMVPYSLTNYYMDEKFHPAKSTLGDITSVAYFLGAIGSAFAGPLARKIGLINTMVFTHVPSSAAVLFFPFPPSLWLTAALLLVRAGLNNLDQAPRSAFIAAVVRPEERTAAMGITSMVRTLAAMAGPSVTGVLAANEKFWIAFVFAGICRLAYDFGLYFMFVNMKLYQHEEGRDKNEGSRGAGQNGHDYHHRRHHPEFDAREDLEMGSLASSSSSSSSGSFDEAREAPREATKPKENAVIGITAKLEATSHSTTTSRSGGALQVPPAPGGAERARSRSPHRLTGLID